MLISGSFGRRLRSRHRLVWVCIALAVGAVAGAAPQALAAPPGFVTASGTSLELDGQPYRFTGINIYNANNATGCWYPMTSGSTLPVSLGAISSLGGPKVIRAWFFQALATSGGQRDWSGFDNTLAQAASRGVKVIVTLGNQWADCDGPAGGAGAFKDEGWYTGGYTQPDPAGTVSYRDWVAEVVNRYKTAPTILAWQLMNEAEVKPSEGAASCSLNASQILKSFATDVSGLIKSIDPDHLVSLGTIGGGQCGAQGAEYQDVHDVSTIDLCEYHDYGSPNVPIPGDQFNGLQVRIDQCSALDKPLFVGETGIRADEVGGSLQARADAFVAKFEAQFGAGIAGELVWAWNKDGSVTSYDIGPGDPTLGVLEIYRNGGVATPLVSLDGEYVDVPDFMPQVVETTSCTDHPDGTQSFEYSITPAPDANVSVFYAHGPYPGQYTFSFTGTLGPPGPLFGPEAGDFWREILDLSGTFTIASGATTVSGTLSHDPPASPEVPPSSFWSYGFCGLGGWDGQIATPYLLYEANITNWMESISDEGQAFDQNVGGLFIGFGFRIGFTSTPLSVDADDDGVADDIDSDGGTGSDPPGFSDDTGAAVATTGTVTAGSVTVEDVADPQGVRITAGSDGATLSVCGSYGLDVPSGGSLTLTCGSVAIDDVAGGSVAVTVPGGAVVTFPTGTSGTVDTAANGAVVVSGISGSGVTMTVDGVVVDLGSGGSWNVMKGTAGNDRIKGTAGNDLIIGYAGNDRIDGGNGADTIDAGTGNNAVKGDAGDDAIAAGAGNDAIDGGTGDDTCTPGGGKDDVRNCETIVR